MKLYSISALALCLAMGTAAFAQMDTTNQDANKAAKEQTAQDHKVDKAQAKADKKTNKALKDDKVEKAAKAQDKANTEAEKAGKTAPSVTPSTMP